MRTALIVTTVLILGASTGLANAQAWYDNPVDGT